MCVVSMRMTSLPFGASAGVVGSDLHIGFRKISGERRCRCPLRVPFDPKVVALGVAYFQMDLSSVVQEAQTVAAGGDIVEHFNRSKKVRRISTIILLHQYNNLLT